MRYSDFKDSPSGRLVPTVYGAKAFVPNDLPPKLNLDDIALTLGDARDAMGELRGACRRLQNPFILIRPLQRLEAQTTSAMEGTFTTAEMLAMTEAGLERNPSADDVEAANYVTALRQAQANLETMPISARLLKSAHATLLRGVQRDRGRDKQPGEFARDQNMIGGSSIENARFIPPPPEQTIEAMTKLERYINRDDRDRRRALIDIALVHYQFETIHPFADGNGRLGRMLITLMAMTTGQLPLPALYMSPELEIVKDDYIDRLYAVSAKGDWSGWLNFFFEALTRSCANTTQVIDEILALHGDFQERVRSASRSANLIQMVDDLFVTPFVDVASIRASLGVSDPGARRLLSQLVDLGILVELDVYPKVWLADRVLRISRPKT